MAFTLHSGWRHLLGGGAAATAIMSADPRSAEACHDDMDVPGYRNDTSVGFVMGVAFGAQTRFFYGLDFRVGSGQTAGIARIEARGISSLRLAAAGHFIGDDNLSAEAGFAFHTARADTDIGEGFGLHLAGGKFDDGGGLQVQGTIPFAGDLRNWDMGGGVVLVPNEWRIFCAGGRRLRHAEADAAVLPAVARLAGETASGDEALARAWIRDAQAEYASIWAFERMAAELRAAGAPDRLVNAALAAAGDEARHAELCSRLAGVPFWLLPLADEHAAPRWSRRSPAALATLACEAWLDGCVGEGIAAAQAAEAVRGARGPAAEAQAIIAGDERRHAELAWSVLEWVWRGADADPGTRDEIAAALSAGEPARDEPAAEGDRLADSDRLAAGGRLPADLARAAAERELDQATRRARRLLG